jgi:D-alanine-D-alanine ligase
VSKKLTVAVALHPELMPDLSVNNIKKNNRLSFPWITEWDVAKSLERLGHRIIFYPIKEQGCIKNLLKESTGFDLVFNLLEEVGSDPKKDFLLPKILNEHEIPFTGCNSEELIFGRDKILAKNKVLKYIKSPKTIDLSRPSFPLILKFNNEDGSYGIFKKNICNNIKELSSRKSFLKKRYKGELYAEEFIEGIESYVSIFQRPNGSIKVFNPRVLDFPLSRNPEKEIYSQMAKWSDRFQSNKKIKTMTLDDQSLALSLKKRAIEIYIGLGLEGPMRIDFRSNDFGVYFLEINPNPNLAVDDDFYLSMASEGISYDEMVESLIEIGLKRHKLRNHLAA